MSTEKDWPLKFEKNLNSYTSIQEAQHTCDLTAAGELTRSHVTNEPVASRPVRRRSRTSRRTPTTILTTDTTNFMAMVQQFTGGPCSSLPTDHPNTNSASGFTLRFGPSAQTDPFQHNPLSQQYLSPRGRYNTQPHPIHSLPHEHALFSVGADSTFKDQFLRHQRTDIRRDDSSQVPAAGFRRDVVVGSSSSNENRRNISPCFK